MSEELSVEEIVSRLDESIFYDFCRNLNKSEEEITALKFLNLSREDKYQLILKYENGKKTPEEIYRIIDNQSKWREFVMQWRLDFHSLKFSGNKITAKTKQRVVNTWLTKTSKENGIDEKTALEELAWMIDDLSSGMQGPYLKLTSS